MSRKRFGPYRLKLIDRGKKLTRMKLAITIKQQNPLPYFTPDLTHFQLFNYDFHLMNTIAVFCQKF